MYFVWIAKILTLKNAKIAKIPGHKIIEFAKILGHKLQSSVKGLMGNYLSNDGFWHSIALPLHREQ